MSLVFQPIQSYMPTNNYSPAPVETAGSLAAAETAGSLASAETAGSVASSGGSSSGGGFSVLA